jgi:hypothetical protein
VKEIDMNAQEQWNKQTNDPLGLRELGAIEPDYDGWGEIETALKAHHAAGVPGGEPPVRWQWPPAWCWSSP